MVSEHPIPVEIYRPEESGTAPLVFMFHGSTGALSIKPGGEPPIDNFGEKTLARNCLTVVFPHYLESIGRKSLTSRKEMVENFPQLVKIAGVQLDRAEALPSVRRRAVFLFGDSLGGYLSIALAFRRSEVAAVSENQGGQAGWLRA